MHELIRYFNYKIQENKLNTKAKDQMIMTGLRINQTVTHRFLTDKSPKVREECNIPITTFITQLDNFRYATDIDIWETLIKPAHTQQLIDCLKKNSLYSKI